MTPIKDGSRVVVTDADGVEHDAVALSSVEGRNQGHSFPVIWVAFGDWDRVPWPVESVRLADKEVEQS